MNGGAGSVLVVEDDDPIRSAVEHGLGMHGFDVRACADATSALAAIDAAHPDLLVLDVGLPGMSGIELCRCLRDAGHELPILVLSARDRVSDRVDGLQAGADDYLVKPFALDELVARLHALMRRVRPPVGHDSELVACGSLRVDAQRRMATVDGIRLDLSRREFDLLMALSRNQEIVLDRIRLLELVWGYDFEVETNVVDVFVGYLRKKLAAAGAPNLIHTVRGVGFVMRRP